MKIKPFKLERYFAKYEFAVKYLLSSSDCDGLSLQDLVKNADDQSRQMWQGLTLGYTDSLGHPVLREEISKLYQNITPGDVLVITPEEGIFITLNLLVSKGDEVICTYPGYQSHYELVESLGGKVIKWMPDEDKEWKFNVDFLKRNINSKTKLILTNFPHNPTGYLPDKNNFDEIIELARNKDVFVFSDEMYRFLELNESDRLPSACETYDKGVTLFGMSKTFGMAGVRIGWIATKDKRLYSEMKQFKDYTTICSSAPSEILSIMALRSKNKIIKNHVERIERNLKILDVFFQKHKDKFGWVRPKAGSIGFPKLMEKNSAYDFCQDVVKRANIMLLPSTVYDYDDRHFRVGFGRENMPEALEKFEEYLIKYY